jgi:hypothetical protein
LKVPSHPISLYISFFRNFPSVKNSSNRIKLFYSSIPIFIRAIIIWSENLG